MSLGSVGIVREQRGVRLRHVRFGLERGTGRDVGEENEARILEVAMAGSRLVHGIWIVVADGEKALFLRNEGDPEYPNFQVVRAVKDENPATRQQGTDQPGRHYDTAMPNKSGFEETDWHRIGKERFAEDIAERLYKLAHKGQFDKLILVAPPVVLGTLRKAIHKEVADCVVDEIPKTLTNHTMWDIEKLLKNAANA